MELSNRAKDLFKSSEVEKERQLIRLVISNLRIEGEKLLYDAQKPFDILIKNADCVSWRPIVDMFCNGSIEMGITLQQVQTAFSLLLIDFSV